jgi:hypothetical protein
MFVNTSRRKGWERGAKTEDMMRRKEEVEMRTKEKREYKR